MKRKQCFVTFVAVGLCMGVVATSAIPDRVSASANVDAAASDCNVSECADNIFSQETEDVAYLDQPTVCNLSEVYADRAGLGYSINAVKTEYFDSYGIRYGAPILESSFHYQMLEDAVYAPSRETTTRTYTDNNMRDMSNQISSSYEYSSEVSGGYKLFYGETDYAYKAVNDIEAKNCYSQYYFKLYSTYQNYEYTLPKYASDLDTYKSHLDSSYEKDVIELLNSGSKTLRDEFFDTYGTHMVACGVFGGAMHMYYNAASNYIDVGTKYKDSLTTSLKASFVGIGAGSATKEFSFAEATEKVSGSYVDRFFVTTRGGSAFSAVTINGFLNVFESWQKTINSNSVLIGTNSDGLVPLWKMLPPAYDTAANQAKMKQLYQAYVREYSVDYSKNDYSGNKSADIGGFQVREEEKKITDSGRFKQAYDKVDLYQRSKYGVTVLQSMGFTKMNIRITLDMREVDKGYQHIFIYNGEGKDSMLLTEKQIELGDTDLQKEWKTETHTLSVSLSGIDLTNPLVVIRYGASGSKDDTWCNKNVNVAISFS